MLSVLSIVSANKCNFSLKTTGFAKLQTNNRRFFYRQYLRLGETPNKNASIVDIRVTRIELHPKAGWTNLRNNLAVLFLERDVEFEEDSGQ